MVTQPTNPAPDVMEPISVDAMEPISADALQTIATAKAKIISLREICSEHVSPEVMQPINVDLDELSGGLDSISGNIEALMAIGEPIPFMAPMPSIVQAIEGIEGLGHEARLMVVDWTLYQGLYPFIGEAASLGE